MTQRRIDTQRIAALRDLVAAGESIAPVAVADLLDEIERFREENDRLTIKVNRLQDEREHYRGIALGLTRRTSR